MAIIFNDKRKKKKVSSDYNYGGFWMDQGDARVDYEGRTGASAVVKALKLRNYQRAIGNFVKILSHKDVPVVFKGTDSYTDGESVVVIAADVNDKNFDITAGLALHEASHIKHTNFEVLKNLMAEATEHTTKMQYKQMLNWVEDRRIDTIVFNNCPGYKAYYHKLYDKYFRSKEIGKMLRSKKYRTETYANYEAHIIGMMNDSFDQNALEILPQVVALIDVNNISRLDNTEEALVLSREIVDMINAHLITLPKEEEEQEEGKGEEGKGEEGEENEESQDKSEDGQDEEDDSTAEGEDSTDTGGAGEDDDEEDDGEDMTPGEENKANEALREAKEMLAGDVNKKEATKNIRKQLGQLQNAQVDYANVGIEHRTQDCIIYRLDKETSKISTLYTLRQQILAAESYNRDLNNQVHELTANLPVGLTNAYRRGMEQQVTEGFQLGAVLGRKLMTRRESRELVTNRLRTGKIDTKRIAHAGYGIENIFNQIAVDSYNKANIHLTIDASGSMGGLRWANSIKMAAALGKAVNMIEGLDLQVSMRETTAGGNSPAVSILYDSRTNKLNHLKMLLEMYECNSMTPEGLCLEAMYKKNLFVKGHPELDSYMINICDGAPGMTGYGGVSARIHTKGIVRKINNDLAIKHVGFFFGEDNGYGFGNFKSMYGVKNSKALPDANNAMAIANHMNKELMTK